MAIASLVIPVIAAALLSYLLCSNASAISKKVGLQDIPDERKTHKQATPLMGGIVLLVAFAPVVLGVILANADPVRVFSLSVWLAVIVGMTFVGILDDRHSLSPRIRLIFSFLIFGLAAYIAPIYNVWVLDFEFVEFRLGLGTRSVAILFTILCCVGLVNAINMADGKNGLVVGLCIGWLVLLALRAHASFYPIICVLLAVLVVLLIYNLKGRLFLGDGGAYGFAAAIGVLSIAVYNSPGTHAARAMAAEEIMLLFAVPVMDSVRLAYQRVRNGSSPMAADRNHFHHCLMDKYGWPQGLFIYWAISLSLGIFALLI